MVEYEIITQKIKDIIFKMDLKKNKIINICTENKNNFVLKKLKIMNKFDIFQ